MAIMISVCCQIQQDSTRIFGGSGLHPGFTFNLLTVSSGAKSWGCSPWTISPGEEEQHGVKEKQRGVLMD